MIKNDLPKNKMTAKKIGAINSSLAERLYKQNINLHKELTQIRWSKCVILGRIKSIMTSMYTERR